MIMWRLKAEFEEKIKGYEAREKEFFEQIAVLGNFFIVSDIPNQVKKIPRIMKRLKVFLGI